MNQEWKYNPENNLLIHWHNKIDLGCIDDKNNIYFLSKKCIYKCSHEDKYCIQMILDKQDSDDKILSMEILQGKYLYFIKETGAIYKLDLESKLIYKQKYYAWGHDYNYKLIKIPLKNNHLFMLIAHKLSLVEFKINNELIIHTLEFKLEGYKEIVQINSVSGVTCTPNNNVYIIHNTSDNDGLICKFSVTDLFDYINQKYIFKPIYNGGFFKSATKLQYCCKITSNTETNIKINKSETIIYEIANDVGISKISLDNLDLKSFEIPHQKKYNKKTFPKFPRQKFYKQELEYQWDNIRDFFIDSDDNIIIINRDNYIYRRTENKQSNSILQCKNDFGKRYLSLLGFFDYTILSVRLKNMDFFKINFF